MSIQINMTKAGGEYGITSASGLIVQLNGLAGGLPFVELRTDVLTPQNGTPSPDAPIPIVGVDTVEQVVAGKNIFTGLTKGIGVDTNTGAEMVRSNYASTGFIPIKFSETLYLSGLANTIASCILLYTSDHRYIGRTNGLVTTERAITKSDFTYIGPEGLSLDLGKYIRIEQYVTVNTPGTIDDVDNLTIQLEVGSTPTPYEPYQSYTLTHTPDTPLYGLEGTSDNVDWVNGVVERRMKLIALDGTELWRKSTSIGGDGSSVYYIDFNDGRADSTSPSLCSNFELSSNIPISSLRYGKYLYAVNAGVSRVFFCSSAPSIDEWTQWLSAQHDAGTPVQVLYKLLNPIKEAFTPTRAIAYTGTNTLWNNAGDTSVIAYQQLGYAI